MNSKSKGQARYTQNLEKWLVNCRYTIECFLQLQDLTSEEIKPQTCMLLLKRRKEGRVYDCCTNKLCPSNGEIRPIKNTNGPSWI